MTDLFLQIEVPVKGTGPSLGRIEVPVSRETFPYLVTTSKSVIWVEEAPRGVLYAAIRTDSKTKIYREITKTVLSRSKRSHWGNMFPLTLEGLASAIEHFKFYGIEDVQVLAPDKSDGFAFLQDAEKVTWLRNYALVVPKDPQYLGTCFSIGENYALTVHNPSRGMAFLCK